MKNETIRSLQNTGPLYNEGLVFRVREGRYESWIDGVWQAGGADFLDVLHGRRLSESERQDLGIPADS